MIFAATVIVLVPSSGVSAEDKGACLACENGKIECADTELEPREEWGGYQTPACYHGEISNGCMQIMREWYRESRRENPPRRTLRAVSDEVTSPVRPATAGQTVHHIHQATLVGWESKEMEELAASVGWKRKKMEELPAGTKFNHANRDGVWGGSGQSGYKGEAIWMTSENDVNAARGYAGSSGKYFVIEAQKPLKLAVMDEQGTQVEPDELGAWATLAQRYGLDGVKTEYGSSYEVILFDRSKITPVEERGFD
ncbi:hypothetical protein RGCCGE502_33601 (plasmid) [Rhizobium grahamii CCGE 502]|uniref:Uncharacterized protein n=2 Tax=Rhizobium grahamii TaxID=1120045 RepID=S3I210_9HYPH|nr:hypothetical protein RGCCGE502_33601 [Rhizobium grahamii CCGE 502]